MKSALIILSCLFAFRFPSARCASPISMNGLLLTMLCLQGVVLHTFESYMVFALFGLAVAFYFALPFFRLCNTWRG
jgi:hypothetical protein